MTARLALSAIAAALASAVFTPGAGAATLVADYQFHGNLASSVPGAPNFTELGSGNEFADASVGCALTFPKGNGLHLDTSGLVASNNFSLVILVRFADVSGFRRILETAGGTSEAGWYVHDGKLDYYSAGNNESSSVVFSNNQYAEVVLTQQPPGSEATVGFVNGVRLRAFPGVVLSNNLGFFKDNTSGGVTNEDSAGAVARIRVYSGVLTDPEVATIYGSLLEEVGGTCPPGANADRASAAVNGKVKVKGGSHGRLVVLTGIDARCPSGVGTCTGIAAVDRAGGSKRLAALSKAAKHLGKKALSVAAGKTQAVKVKLTRKASDALRAKGKLRVKISVNLAAPGGTPAVASRKAKLKPPRS